MIRGLWRLVVVGVALAAALAPSNSFAQAAPVNCQLFQAGPSPYPVLDVNWTSRFYYVAPQAASDVSGSGSVVGYPGWAVFFDNHTGSGITNPTVTLSSGLDPAVFDGQIPSFPFACSLPGLDANQQLQIFPGLEATGLHSSFSLGYDSKRSVTPAVVPAGGGNVTVQFTVTLTNSRYAGGGFVYLNINHGLDTSIVSQTPPTNLDQGEMASASGGFFSLSNAQLGKPYVFTAVVHVGSTPAGQPWTWEPGAQIFVSGRGEGCALACNASGSSVSFTDSSLDGATPGSGAVTLSIGQNDRRWNVGTSTQYVTLYRGGLFPDVRAQLDSGVATGVPATTNSVTHGTSFGNGVSWFWGFDIKNFQPGNTVTSPTISVASGYDPSQLFPNFGAPASALPIVLSQPSLPSGSDLQLGLGSSIAATLVPACDTSRSVTPATVPLGGGDQTFTFSVQCFDPGVRNVNGGVGHFLPGSTVVSFTPPDNLDQGEGLNAPPSSWFGAPGDAHAGFGIGIENLVTGKQYTFTFIVHSPDPFGLPYAQTAGIGLVEESPQPTGCAGCGGPAMGVTIGEPTLDGPTPGAGQVTFSAGEAHVWLVDVWHERKIEYGGTDQRNLVYQGPPSAVDGQTVTLTASWDGIQRQATTPVTFTIGRQSCTATTGAVENPFGDQGAVCSIRLAQPPGSYTLQVSSPGDVSVYPASSSAPFSITGPAATDECNDGRWSEFGIFTNQGDCVSYVDSNGKNPPG